jgi:hypothetical protein
MDFEPSQTENPRRFGRPGVNMRGRPLRPIPSALIEVTVARTRIRGLASILRTIAWGHRYCSTVTRTGTSVLIESEHGGILKWG